MLSIGAIAAGGQGYYSRDDYYTSNAAEYTIQGEYLGTGPGLLGLTDPERDFPHLLKGDHPDGRSLIGESPKAHRPGLDLTLSAPKSVSLLALVAGDTRVLEAHDRAVRQTMAFIEREYIRARGTVDGQTTHLSTSNLTAIAYRHETTRPIEGTPDPQLHTHSVLFNFTQRPDGEWRAISNEAILDNQKVIDAAYKSYLERNLHELGFATTRTANGFEVRGVPADLLSEFSRRHKDILTSMSIHPGQTSRDAAVYTREPKANERDPAARLQLWLDRAAALGSTPASIRAAVAREGELARASAAPPQGPPSGPARLDHAPEPGREIDRVIAALERDTAWWTRDDMLRAGSPYLRGNLTPEDFSRQIDAAGNRGDLLKLGENKFTSPDALRTEQAIIGHVTNTRTHADPPPAHDAAAIEQRWSGRNPGQTPTGEQVAAAGFLVGSQDHVIALQGPPGTGKTSVLGVAHDLWREQGYTVTGLAQVKQAAENLQSRTDIPSQTIEGYLQKHADPSQTGSSEPAGKQILVIDEAAVVGSRNMLDLLEAAARNHVEKIVLVGDTRQLEPIGAGKPFEDLLSRGLIPAADLTQVQRQHEGTLREAVNALYNKDTPRAVELLDTIGAIREHAELNAFGKPDIPVETMARDFAALDPERRADTLVQLPTHRHRDAFNDAAREHLKARGEVDRASERTFQVWRPLNLSHAEKLDPARYPQGGLVEFFRAKPDQQIPQGARGIIEGVTPNHQLTLRFPADGDRRLVFDPASHWKFNVLEPRDLKVAIGDTLVFGKNDKTLGVTNGMRGQVVALGDNSITVRIEKGDRLVTVDPRQYPYLDHGLASTIHKAQGQTVKHVMVGINPDDRHETANRGYTAITRAEESVTIYTPSKAGLVESMSEWAAHRSVMGEAMGEQGWHAGPGPQGQSAPTTGVTQAPEQAVASSEPTPSPFTSWPAHTVSPPVIPTPEREREHEVKPNQASTQEIKETAPLPKEPQQQGENEREKVTAEVIRYETKDAIHLLPAGTSINDLLRGMSQGMQTTEGPPATLSEPFTYGTRHESHQIPAGTSIDNALKQIEGNVRTVPGQEKTADQNTTESKTPGVGQESAPTTGTGQAGGVIEPPATTPTQTTGTSPGQAGPFFAQAGQAISPPVIPTPEREREGNKGKTEPEQGKEKKEPEQDTGKGKTEQDKETTGKQSDGKGFDFKRWPEHTVSPPVIPTPEREREQKPEEKTEKKPEKEQAAKELDQEKEKEKEKHPSGAPTKGGADAEDTPQTKDASQPDDRRPLNRAGQMLYGPDRLRATFGPKHWRASAMQPNQTWAKSKYVLQAKSFGEGLRRMTHRVRAVRVQQTWAGRGNAIREAKGAWGTLKAAYAPTAKTIYLVDKPFRGVRHAGRIASAPTIGSAFRRTFERQERVYDPKAKEFVGQQRQPSGRSDVARGPQPPSTFWKALATVSRVGLGYRPPDQPNRFERWLGNITKESGDGWKKIGGVTKKETLHATRSAWSGLKEAGAGWAKIGITGGRGLAHAATTISRVARQAGSKLKQQVEKLGRGKTGQTPDKDKPVEQTERKPAPTPATTPEQTTAVTPGQAGPFFAQAGQAISPPVIPTPEREREGNKGKTEPEQGKEKKEPEQDTGKGKTEQDKETTGKQSDGKGFDFKRWPEHTVSPPVIPTPEREREQQTTSLTPTTGTGQSTGLATTTGQAVDKDKSTQAPSPEKADKDAPPHDKAGPQSKDAPQSKEGPPQAKEPSHDKSAGGKSPRDPKGHPEPQKEAPGPGGSKGREAADQGKGKTPGREKKPEQDKDARSHQNDRLKFQQEGSSEKSEKGKEDFGRG